MKRESIFFTITVSFIISLLLVIVSFGLMMFNSQKHLEHELRKRYFPVSKMVIDETRKFGITENLISNLRSMNLSIIAPKNARNAILYNPDTKIEFERLKDKKIFRILNLNDDYYIFIRIGKSEFLIKDENSMITSDKIYILTIFAIIILTIVLSYMTTIRKLMPLKLLKDKVSSLGDENFDFECCNLKGNDEVSQLAKEFKKSAEKLKSIKKARNIFIRNIMHELKTPITKGKILAELPSNEENSEKMQLIFDRLNQLINEFATIEELISSNINIEKSIYYLVDIVENATDILMCEEEEVVNEYENLKLEVNFRLFTLAIKNLIDNAIKYSDNKKAVIKTEEENIIIENSGSALEYSLEEYFEPFSNKDSHGNSFGLGLYIVYNILSANGYELKYEYIDGVNRFIICKKI